MLRVLDGVIKKGMEILLMSTNTRHPVERVGVFTPKAENKEWGTGQIQSIIKNIVTVNFENAGKKTIVAGSTLPNDRSECEEINLRRTSENCIPCKFQR